MNDANKDLFPQEDNYSNLGDLEPEEVSTSVNSNINSYTCNDCKCIFSSNLNASKCVACNSTNISNNEVKPSNAMFIPFYRSISNALDDYKYKTKGFMIPKSFKDKKIVNCIKKVYLPAYLVDVNVKGQVKYFGADKIGRNETSKYELVYDSNFDFKNVLVCGYSKINDIVFNKICSYQYNKSLPYSDDLFNDSYFISYDLVPLEISNKINNRVMKHCLNEIRGNITHSLKKLHKNEMDVKIKEYNKIYVPVYILNFRYNNKKYFYLMNGQSGDSYIDLEYSRVAIIIFSIILFIIIFGCAFLFAYFF